MSLTITIIQPNIAWEDKKLNLELLTQKIESIRERTEVVILPEMFSTGFSMNTEGLAEKMEGETIQWMSRISRSKKVILTGSIIVSENEKYFNRLIWMLPDGKYGYYDKRHLFAFAGENKHFTAGKKRLIAAVKGWRINLQICYDLRFPVWARQSQPPGFFSGNAGGQKGNGEPEYDILLYVANWPRARIPAWETLLKARAIENQCYVVGANRVGEDGNQIVYNGNSMVVDPLGEALYQKEGEEDVFTITLQKHRLDEVRAKFPFLKDADEFKL